MEIREARREDCKQIGAYVQELANFEKMPDGPKIGYKGERPLWSVFEVTDPW